MAYIEPYPSQASPLVPAEDIPDKVLFGLKGRTKLDEASLELERYYKTPRQRHLLGAQRLLGEVIKDYDQGRGHPYQYALAKGYTAMLPMAMARGEQRTPCQQEYEAAYDNTYGALTSIRNARRNLIGAKSPDVIRRAQILGSAGAVVTTFLVGLEATATYATPCLFISSEREARRNDRDAHHLHTYSPLNAARRSRFWISGRASKDPDFKGKTATRFNIVKAANTELSRQQGSGVNGYDRLDIGQVMDIILDTSNTYAARDIIIAEFTSAATFAKQDTYLS